MAGFRGVFDGSVEIGQNREARDAEMQRLQAQLAAQMAMQTQRIQAEQRSQAISLSANVKQANANRAQSAQQFRVTTDLNQQKQDLDQAQFDAGASVREMQQRNAKLLLQQAQQEFDDDQVRRGAQTAFRQSAFGAGILSAMLKGVVAPTTLSKINQANGVADGDPGSVIGMGGGPDGAWYDVIAQDEQGNLGKKRQEVDPMALLTVAHSVLGKDGAKEWAQMYRTKDTNNTRMNVALTAYQRAMDQQTIKDKTAKELLTQKGDQAMALQDKKGEQTAARLASKEQSAMDLANRTSRITALSARYQALKDPFGQDGPEALKAKAELMAATNEDGQNTDPLAAAIDGGTPTEKATQTRHGAVAAPAPAQSSPADNGAGWKKIVEQAGSAMGVPPEDLNRDTLVGDLTAGLDKLDKQIASARKFKAGPSAELVTQRNAVRQALHDARLFIGGQSATPSGRTIRVKGPSGQIADLPEETAKKFLAISGYSAVE